MKKYIALRHPMLVAFSLLFSWSMHAQNEPTISTCTGQQNFCLTAAIFDLCVEIAVDPSFTASIDSFVIDWDDGTQTTIVVGGPVPPTPIPANLMHSYNFNGFYGTCMAKEDRTIFLFTYYNGNAVPLNNGFFMNVFNPPIAAFTTDSPICLGETLQLTNNSCPTQGLTIWPWNYGDGNTGASNTHTYNSAGTYTVSLTVSNNCDTVTTNHQVQVLELPVSNPVATEGIKETILDTLVVCLGDTICLNGDSLSLNETSWRWDFLTNISNACFDYVPAPPPSSSFDVSILPRPKLVFFCDGVYRLELRVDNPCGHPDSKVLIFKVVKPPIIDFHLHATACTPTITLNPADSLEVMGELTGCLWDLGPLGISTLCDPGNLTFDTSTVITFTGFNQCDTVSQGGSITLTASGQAIITSLCPDTLCSNDPPCTLSANLAGGNWTLNGSSFNGTFNPATASIGMNTINYGAPPCIQPAQVGIFVISSEVDISGPVEVCIDGGTVTYSATPPGGIFFASSGAIDPVTGVYDPILAGAGPDTIFYQTSSITFCQGNSSLPIQVVDLEVGFEVVSCNGLEICFDTTPNTSNYNSIFWNFGVGQTSTQPPVVCHTFPNANTYDVTVTITAGVCTATYTDTVAVVEPPSANFSLSYLSPACGPLAVTVNDHSTGDDLTYTWNIGGTIIIGPDPGPISLNNTAVISLTVSNDCGSSSYSETVEVEPSPVALFGANQYVCSGDTLDIFNNSTNFTSLFWDFDNGQTSTDTGALQQVVYFTSNDNDTITITLIAKGTCPPDTFSQEVIVVPTDAQAFVTTTAAPLFQVCQNEQVCFESFSLPSGVPLQWDFGDGNTTTGFNICHAWNAPGVYKVVSKLVSCGFDSTITTITVLAIPVAAFTPPSAGCPGEDLLFENHTVGAISFLWTFGDGDSSTIVAPNHAYDSAGLYQVCLIALSANGCRDTVCQNMEISAPPNASFTFDNPGCQGDNVVFTNTSPNIVSCSWDFDNGDFSADCNPTAVFDLPGNYNVTLTATNASGCTSSASQIVLVGELPIPSFSFQMLDTCHPVTVFFTNTSQLAEGYEWNFGDGNTSTQTNPQHVYVSPGTYTVTLTAISDGICTAVDSQFLTVEETPVANISLAQNERCFGESFPFQSASTGSIFNLEWDFGDGLYSFEENPNHTYGGIGNFQVVLTVFNGNVCKDSDTLQLNVHPPVLATAETTDVLCFGDTSGEIDVTISSGTPVFEFDWSNGAVTEDNTNLSAGNYTLLITDTNGCTWDSTMTVQQPPVMALTQVSEKVVSCAGGSDGGLCVEPDGGVGGFIIAWENGMDGKCLTGMTAGVYAVSLTDANGCELDTGFEVRENPPIEIMDSVRHRPCFGADVAFIRIDALEGGIGWYSLMLEGNDGFLETGYNFSNLRPGPYHLTVMDSLGCTLKKDYFITEPDSIWLNILEDSIQMELGEDAVLEILHNLGQPMFNWSPPQGLDCTDCPEPIARPFDDVEYNLTMTDGNGCRVNDRVLVLVDEVRTIYIPNIFTPNDDGRNDVFRIRSSAKSIKQVNIFQITNRWGEVLFEAKDFDPLLERLEDAWDGKFRGEALPPDTYYYFAQIQFVDGVVKPYEGSVMLVR